MPASLALAVAVALPSLASAFVVVPPPVVVRSVAKPRLAAPTPRMAATAAAPEGFASAIPPLPVCPTKPKLVRTLIGLYFTVCCFGSALIVYPPLIIITLVSLFIDNKRRRWCDWVVQAWARLTLTFMGASVTVEGKENLPPYDEAVLYAPNHCSFLDIFAMSGFLGRRFKYVSKIEILRIPLIGWAMQFAKHIAIRRSDRASQMQTLRDAIDCLASGSSLVTFPEGTRSKDGRLLPFKKGPFTMASRSGVRVVPVSIVGTHIFQPAGWAHPLWWPRGIRIIVHPPLEVPTKKTEVATLEACKTAIESALHPSMLPLSEN